MDALFQDSNAEGNRLSPLCQRGIRAGYDVTVGTSIREHVVYANGVRYYTMLILG